MTDPLFFVLAWLLTRVTEILPVVATEARKSFGRVFARIARGLFCRGLVAAAPAAAVVALFFTIIDISGRLLTPRPGMLLFRLRHLWTPGALLQRGFASYENRCWSGIFRCPVTGLRHPRAFF